MKRYFAFFLSIIMLLTTNMTIYAKEDSGESSEDAYIVAEVAEKYSITEDEVLNLTENVKKALEEADTIQDRNIDGERVQEIPVSENLVMVLTTKLEAGSGLAIERAIGKRYTVTASLDLKNMLGMTVITLNSVGVFESDFTTCTPVDAYGTYEAKVWNVTNSSSSLGSPQFNAYARNSFSGELNIGIDAVNMTVQAFGYTSTLHCDALGHYSADWN